jgi:hypothetical protein
MVLLYLNTRSKYMQSASKQNESAVIAQFAQTAMRFQIGTRRAPRTLYRYGRAPSVPMQRVAAAIVRTQAGLQELAAATQFAPMQFEARAVQDTRYMQMRHDAHALQVAHERTQPANSMPYAMVAYRLHLRQRAANAAMHR